MVCAQQWGHGCSSDHHVAPWQLSPPPSFSSPHCVALAHSCHQNPSLSPPHCGANEFSCEAPRAQHVGQPHLPPTPRSKALGLPQRVPSPSLNHRMSGKSCPTGSRVCTSWPLRGPKRPTQITLQRKRSGVDVGLGRTGLGRPPFSPICSEEFPSPLC